MKIKLKTFKIRLKEDYYKRGDMLVVGINAQLKVTSTPKMHWFRRMLVFLKLAQKKVYYKVKVVE